MTDSIKANETFAGEGRVSTYRRRILAWSMYDWADHGIITTTLVTFFPPYFIAIAAPAFLEAGKLTSDKAAMAIASDSASNVFSLVLALALFIAAIVAPILGTYADITGRRKRILIVVTAVGSLLASFMITLTTGLWLLGLALYAGTQVAVNIALGLNSSLLPHVSRPEDLNRVSTMAYALGYVGGSLLLAANAALYLFADKLGISGDTAVRIAFFTTGVWWLLFTLCATFSAIVSCSKCSSPSGCTVKASVPSFCWRQPTAQRSGWIPRCWSSQFS